MKKVLEYCYLNDCVFSASFEIPMQVTLSVRNWRLGKIKQQMLPWTTQLTDEAIFNCVKWMIDELEKSKSKKEWEIENYTFIKYPETKTVDIKDPRIPHTVKRLTDNTKWSVGMIDCFGKIKSFYIEGNTMYVSHEDGVGNYGLSELSEKK